MKTAHAWRLLRPDGRPTCIILTLPDTADGDLVALVASAAKRHGVELEPIQPDEPLDASGRAA